MHSAHLEDPCAPHCPGLIREALDLIAGKWTVPIFFALHRARTPLRYADLRRRLEPVTPKELTRHLRQMETAGLIERRVHDTVPPSVDYALTELGNTLHPSFESLTNWAAHFADVVAENRKRGERPAPPRLIRPVYRVAG
jgi:DNA-binding HxlR family transcriptional regulator